MDFFFFYIYDLHAANIYIFIGRRDGVLEAPARTTLSVSSQNCDGSKDSRGYSLTGLIDWRPLRQVNRIMVEMMVAMEQTLSLSWLDTVVLCSGSQTQQAGLSDWDQAKTVGFITRQ